ncbi:hypothetical protein B0H13DRAFT_2335721 [Mycena leptocephala]|nr:hypothetical protein B0H13DRAFT_2335721 [Mycena leptocephala]
MYFLRVAGVALLFRQNVFALEFGSLDRSISVGQTTEITWASDSTDPAVWELAVIDRNADIVATVDSVDGSAGQFSFSFPAVESRSRPFFALQALSGGEVLATSEPFRVAPLDETQSTSSATPTSATVLPVLPSDSAIIPTQIQTISSSQYPTLIASPSASVAMDLDDSHPAPALNVPALVAGPILGVVTVGVVTFILLTLCGCRRHPSQKIAEP